MAARQTSQQRCDVQTPKTSYPQLLSLAVHEFRTPASVVGGYLRMLQRDTEAPLSDRQRKMIDEAEKSCARLVAIVAELSDVAKLDSGDLKLAGQPLELFSLINQVAELVHEAKDRAVRLEVRGATDGARLTGDPVRLRSAFDAIFRAILREKPGQCVVVADCRIETIEGRPTAVVIVAEEPSVQAAYDREAGPFDERRGGMGLALPLARRVIEGHGGRIWAPAAVEPAGAVTATTHTVDDALARGSAIISLPITEQPR
jgi:signal transduction histidine kinase